MPRLAEYTHLAPIGLDAKRRGAQDGAGRVIKAVGADTVVALGLVQQVVAVGVEVGDGIREHTHRPAAEEAHGPAAHPGIVTDVPAAGVGRIPTELLEVVDLRPVLQPVGVRIGAVGVGVELKLQTVRQPILVGIRRQWVSVRGVDLVAVGQPVAVAVPVGRVGSPRRFLGIGQAVAVAVRVDQFRPGPEAGQGIGQDVQGLGNDLLVPVNCLLLGLRRVDAQAEEARLLVAVVVLDLALILDLGVALSTGQGVAGEQLILATLLVEGDDALTRRLLLLLAQHRYRAWPRRSAEIPVDVGLVQVTHSSRIFQADGPRKRV